MKALSEISAEQSLNMIALSAYDTEPDERYISRNFFKGYKGNKLRLVLDTLARARNARKVFIAHINLSLIGLLIKTINPGVKLYLITHGVEVWNKTGLLKTLFLRSCYRILAVSNFTKNKIVENHGIIPERVIVFHNTVDPYFKIPAKFEKPGYILEKLEIDKNDIVLLTLGRISFLEGRKGYSEVLTVLSEIKDSYKNLKYIIVGKYDQKEYKRIEKMISEKKLTDIVKITGFIAESELTDYYLTSDIFIMPSRQEGFGIVFLEAMVCGVPVIAGNRDGSRDAMIDNTYNRLVDPDNSAEIKSSLIDLITKRIFDKNVLRDSVLEKFSYTEFKNRLHRVIVN